MELLQVEVSRHDARARCAEYRAQARRERDPRAKRELEEIARAYTYAAKEGTPLISLSTTIAAGGTMTRTFVEYKGRENERRTHFALPKLACIRADAAFAYTKGVERDGSVQFVDRLYPSDGLRKGRTTVSGLTLDEHHTAAERMARWDGRALGAMVPIVPPRHRPRANTRLSEYHVLWEVDDWAWLEAPKPPVDPALLKHLGGDIYAVVATWDLTDLERLVLAGRRPE